MMEFLYELKPGEKCLLTVMGPVVVHSEQPPRLLSRVEGKCIETVIEPVARLDCEPGADNSERVHTLPVHFGFGYQFCGRCRKNA